VGTLTGIRVVEVGGVGPGPFAGMMLGDHGAEVIRVDRPGAETVGVLADRSKDVLLRSRKSVVADLKRPEGVAFVRKLCATADILIEGFRPGVMERLGLGPETLLRDHPRLVYGRVTGISLTSH
jgi:alpha-methylacyl-CoA racemase